MSDVSYPAERKPRRRGTHPGQIIASLLEDLQIPEGTAARRIGVSVHRLQKILKGKAPITPKLAAGVGRYLGNGARIWIALQENYDHTLGYQEPKHWPYRLWWRQDLQKYSKWCNRTILVLRPRIE